MTAPDHAELVAAAKRLQQWLGRGAPNLSLDTDVLQKFKADLELILAKSLASAPSGEVGTCPTNEPICRVTAALLHKQAAENARLRQTITEAEDWLTDFRTSGMVRQKLRAALAPADGEE